jgi:cobyric acid synthase
MIHGIFDNDAVRASLVASLRARKGLPPIAASERGARPFDRRAEYDRLADAIRDHMDTTLLARLVR